MKAFLYHRYGSPDVLQLEEVDKPVPRANEVLIRTLATTVSSGDGRMRSLEVPAGFGWIIRLVAGLRRPRQPILGSELAGVVEAVGQDVTRFQVGDAVFAFSDLSLGCHAAYRCLAEDGGVALKPSALSFEEAAALSFGGTTALDFLRRAKLKRGERILIHGASGCVGSAAVQLACHLGAEVTGVCSSRNLELVRSLGAHQVIDYTQDDVTRQGHTYDVIVDAVGTASFSSSRALLRPGGRLLLLVASLPALLLSGWQSLTTDQSVIAGPASVKAGDLEHLAALAAAGVYRPVLDRRYPFEQIPEAHRYVDTGHKRGTVVITLET